MKIRKGAALDKVTDIIRKNQVFTKKDYENAIQRLKDGMSQLEADGNCCAICGDNGHQAMECHHNPLVLEKVAQGWRCFHCGLVFYTEEGASLHFGEQGAAHPVCII